MDPGLAWTWRQRSPGGTTLASHQLVALGGGRTLSASASTSGARVGVAVGLLARRLTRRYLDMEGQGLEARSEQRRDDASTA